MFTYTLRNLRFMFTKQRLLAILLLMNIVVSCLVICFSYGVYQNYNVIVQKGEKKEKYDLDIRLKDVDAYIFEPMGLPTADITPQMLIDFSKMLSYDTRSNIKYIYANYYMESPLYYIRNNDEYDEEYATYSDDADSAYGVFSFCFKPEGDRVVDAYDVGDIFDDDRYNRGDKIIGVTLRAWGDKYSGVDGVLFGNGYSVSGRKLSSGTRSILIGGESYEITYTSGDEGLGVKSDVVLPITAVPDGAAIELHRIATASGYVTGQYESFFIMFNEPVTGEQFNDVKNCLDDAFGGMLFLPDIEFVAATEIYYYKTIMLISVIIAVLSAINMAILYRYILEKRSSELAIFRICGCSKGKAIASYLFECTIINAPLFVLTELCYHKLIMPQFTDLFPNMSGSYSFKIYSMIFGLYIGASIAVMLVMIVLTIRKHSLVSLKSAPKATSKFGIMKVFEIIQLAAVLSIMVLIVSAIVSRYELYLPFEQYFERKGYMVRIDDYAYLADFEEMIGDAQYIMTQLDGVANQDPVTGEKTELTSIKYSDEFVQAYAPPLHDGVWLDKADFTYENSGYIPAVVTYCDDRYKVGDIIEYDMYGVTDDDRLIMLAHIQYKIIGVIKDNVNIASYTSHGFNVSELHNDYRDIYKVFSEEYEEDDYLLTKFSDDGTCWKEITEKALEIEELMWADTGGSLGGIQFVFCEGSPEDQYEDLGRKLRTRFSFAVPLSEVRQNSLDYIYEQMYTLFPIAACIFILTIISTVSISAIYTKRQLRNYAIFYICGARWRTCALKSLKNGAITCSVSAILSALILAVGKATILSETVISFGLWHLAVCSGVIVLYLALSMIMPLSIIGSSEPREVLKEE